MEIKDYLLDELKRLNRLNDLLEKNINQGKSVGGEQEKIIKNVSAMCEIANTL